MEKIFVDHIQNEFKEACFMISRYEGEAVNVKFEFPVRFDANLYLKNYLMRELDKIIK